MFTENIGPFIADADLGTINVSLPAANSLIVSGTAVNCIGQTVTNGFALLTLEGLKYGTAITNGSFSFAIDRCSGNADSARLIIGDYTTVLQSPTQSYLATTGQLNVGQIVACGIDFTQFISYSLNGVNYQLTSPPDSIITNTQGIKAMTKLAFGSTNYLALDIFRFSTYAAGTYSMNLVGGYLGQTLYGCKPSVPFQVTITTFGNTGESIIGSFSGNVYTDTTNGIPYPLSGTFKVIRDF